MQRSHLRNVSVFFLLALAACAQLRMPNSGVRSTEDRLVAVAEPRSGTVGRAGDAEPVPASGGPSAAEPEPAAPQIGAGVAAGFSDKAMAQAAKVAAELADKALRRLEDEFTSDLTLRCLLEAELGIPGEEHELILRRVVRIDGDRFQEEPAPDPDESLNRGLFSFLKSSEKPSFTKQVWDPFLRKVAASDTSLEVQPEETEKLYDGWFLKPNARKGNGLANKRLQLTTHQVNLVVQVARLEDKVFRIKEGTLRVFFPDATLPNYEEIRDRFEELIEQQETAPAGSKERAQAWFRENLDKIWMKADNKLMDELGLKVAASLRIAWEDPRIGRQERMLNFGVKNVWSVQTKAVAGAVPAGVRLPATHPGADVYIDAPAYKLDLSDQEWFPKPGRTYSLQLHIAETSQVAEWIEMLRERLKDWASRKLN